MAAYPVLAELEVGDDGQLIVSVSGRIPNYDDIEALFDLTPAEARVAVSIASGKTISGS